MLNILREKHYLINLRYNLMVIKYAFEVFKFFNHNYNKYITYKQFSIASKELIIFHNYINCISCKSIYILHFFLSEKLWKLLLFCSHFWEQQIYWWLPHHKAQQEFILQYGHSWQRFWFPFKDFSPLYFIVFLTVR